MTYVVDVAVWIHCLDNKQSKTVFVKLLIFWLAIIVVMKFVARFFDFKFDSTSCRGEKNSKMTNSFWISSSVNRHQNWKYIFIFMNVEDSIAPFSSQSVYMQIEPTNLVFSRFQQKGSFQSLHANADDIKSCDIFFFFKQRERKGSTFSSSVRLNRKSSIKSLHRSFSTNMLVYMKGKPFEKNPTVSSFSRPYRKGSDRSLHESDPTRMLVSVEIESFRKNSMHTQNGTSSAWEQIERTHFARSSICSLQNSTFTFIFELPPPLSARYGEILFHFFDTGIKRINLIRSLFSSSGSEQVERKNPSISSMCSLQASASTSISELPFFLSSRPDRQISSHSKTKIKRNNSVRISFFASTHVGPKNSANSSIFPLQTPTSTFIFGLSFSLPPRSYRDDSCQSSDTENNRTNSHRSLFLFSRRGINDPFESFQRERRISRLDLSSNEIINIFLHTTHFRRNDSAFELSPHQIIEIHSCPRKDSSFRENSNHFANDFSSLPLIRTKSINSSFSNKTSTASLFSIQRNRSSISFVLDSVIFISESSRTLFLFDIFRSVAEIIDDSLESRNWNKRHLDFDWNLSKKKLNEVENMIAFLKKFITIRWTSSKSIINITSLIRCHVHVNINTMKQYFTFAEFEQTRIKKLIEISTTQIIWDLLSSDSTRERPFSVVTKFCQYFFLLMNKMKQNWKLPYWISVKIRCRVNPQYRQIWHQFHREGFYKTKTDLIVYIDRIHSSFIRAMTLIIMLEIIIEDFSPIEISKMLKTIIVQRKTLDFLINVKKSQLANLLAIYVRRMKIVVFSNKSRFWSHTLFDEMMYFIDQIWNFCSPWYNVNISERSILFDAIIAKFEGIEILFCLWIFMHCLSIKHDDRIVISVKTLYDQLIDRYIFLSSVKNHPWLMPNICVVNFIVFANQWSRDEFFFDLLQKVMKVNCEQKRWKYVWHLCKRQKMFEKLINCQRKRLTKALEYCVIYDDSK